MLTLIDVENIKTRRAGVIPYTIVNNFVYFLLGTDSNFGELTDFGGGVKKDETCIMGAFREFKEETNGIFDSCIYDYNQFKNSLVFTDFRKMTLLFLKIDNTWLSKAVEKFHNNKHLATSKYSKEISELVWLHENKFKQTVNKNFENLMWNKIRCFIQQHHNDNFYLTLKQN